MPRKKADAAADENRVNKAEEIRQAAKAIGKRVRPRDIIAALKEKGIVVSSAQVSTTLHNAGFRRRRRRAAVAVAAGTASGNGRRSAASGKLSLESLLAAKSFIDRVGSVDKAEEAISALKKLR